MTTNTKTLAQMLDDIKIEARVKGSDNLDSWITNLIHSLLASAVQNKRYFELLVLNTEIITEEEVGVYDLPEDFMAMKQVSYRTTSGVSRCLFSKTHYVELPAGRSAKYWEIAGASLVISPVLDVPDDDVIVFDYWKAPTIMELDDPFPIPKLIESIMQKAIARTLNYNKEIQQASLLQTEGAVNQVLGHNQDNA